MESSGILLDADVISHFMASGEQALLCKVLNLISHFVISSL